MPHSNIYQVPCGIVVLAAAIEAVLTLGFGPIVLIGHSLGCAIALETAARVFHDHPDHPDWLAGVAVLAPQGAGLHCDNKGKVNSMQYACQRLGELRCPLLVYHGLADTSISSSVGEQVFDWHAAGASIHRDADSFAELHLGKGDDHTATDGAMYVRDFVEKQLLSHSASRLPAEGEPARAGAVTTLRQPPDRMMERPFAFFSVCGGATTHNQVAVNQAIEPLAQPLTQDAIHNSLTESTSETAPTVTNGVMYLRVFNQTGGRFTITRVDPSWEKSIASGADNVYTRVRPGQTFRVEPEGVAAVCYEFTTTDELRQNLFIVDK